MTEDYSYEDKKQQQGRSPDSLIAAIDRIERLEKQLKIAVEVLKEYADGKYKNYELAVRAYVAKGALKEIEELENEI